MSCPVSQKNAALIPQKHVEHIGQCAPMHLVCNGRKTEPSVLFSIRTRMKQCDVVSLHYVF